MENRNGLAVAATLTQATGTAEREAALAMLDRRPAGRRVTLGADKAYDVEAFVGALRSAPVDAAYRHPRASCRRPARPARPPIDDRTLRHAGYAISQRIRKRIEEIFGWIKTPGGLAKVESARPGEGRGRLRLRRRRLQPRPHPQAARAAGFMIRSAAAHPPRRRPNAPDIRPPPTTFSTIRQPKPSQAPLFQQPARRKGERSEDRSPPVTGGGGVSVWQMGERPGGRSPGFHHLRVNGAMKSPTLSLVTSVQSNSCFSLAAPVLPVLMNESASSTAFFE